MEAYFDSHSASRDKIIATLRRVGETALCRRRALLLNNFLTKGSDAVPNSALSYLGSLEIANKNFPLKLMILKGAELPKPPHIFSGRKKTDKATIRKRGCRYRERSVALFNPPPSCVETKPPAYLSVYRGRRACFRRRRIAGERMAKKGRCFHSVGGD